nr:MAG TPA: hypothetical protein [Caudoviricetes sp.]
MKNSLALGNGTQQGSIPCTQFHQINRKRRTKI